MKKLCNASAIAAFLTAVCFTAVSCNKTPSESTLPVEKELGVSIELTSATETSVSVDITAEKDAEGYIYAIGEAGKGSTNSRTVRWRVSRHRTTRPSNPPPSTV